MENTKQKEYAWVFNIRSITKTLSYNDLLTAVTLALCLLAINKILEYYWIDRLYWTTSMVFLIPLNHFLYQIEHGKSNRFIGHVLHNLFLVWSYYFLARIYTSGSAAMLELEISSFILSFSISIMAIVVLEGLLIMAKDLFRLLPVANLSRLKLGGLVLSAVVLALIPLLKSNFHAPVTIKRWGKLSWSDFKGIPRPFSNYAAEISSKIFLDYDSVNAKYFAYAGQNDIESWAHESVISSDYALNHEQYHFNITAFFAQLLNEYITKNPDGSKRLFEYRLESLNLEMNEMQTRYDNETNHSLNYDQQRKWEYKIDSLVMVHAGDAGQITDSFTGAQVYFPISPEYEKGIDSTTYRRYSLSRYDMSLSMTVFRVRQLNHDDVRKNLRDFYDKVSFHVKSFTLEQPSSRRLKALVVATDSLDRTYQHLWICQDEYQFKIAAMYPNNNGNTEGYETIAKSFLNSFSVSSSE